MLPEIATARLTVRLARPGMEAAIADFLAENFAGHLDRWSPPPVRGFFTRGFWAERLAVAMEEFEADRAVRFVLRDLAGEGLSRWPTRTELARLAADNGDVHVMVYPKRGADLAREMKWLGSYRYGVFNMGAESSEALFARFHRISRQITFHPRGQQPLLELQLAEAGPRA